MWNRIYLIKKQCLKILWIEVWKGEFQLIEILVLLGMYFDAMVVFFTRLWPYCVCHKTASRNTSFLVTCLVKKHHLFDKPIPKNLHSQLETCVCTCNFMVKKWITTWEKKWQTYILATIFPQFLTLCSGASVFGFHGWLCFGFRSFQINFFFSFSCFSTSEWEERSYPKQD